LIQRSARIMMNRDEIGGTPTPSVMLWLIFFAYTTAIALLVQLVILPYIFPSFHAGGGVLLGCLDCSRYHELAVELAKKIHAEGWSAWKLRVDDIDMKNLHPTAGIAGAIYALTVPKLWTTIPVTAAMHATATLILLKIIQIFIPRWRVAIWFILPFLLFPSAMVWYTQNLKDGYHIAGMFAFLYGWLLLAGSGTWISRWRKPLKAVSIIAFGLFLCWLVRPNEMKALHHIEVLIAIFLTCIILRWIVRIDIPRKRAIIAFLVIWGIVAATNFEGVYPENYKLDAITGNTADVSMPAREGAFKTKDKIYIFLNQFFKYEIDMIYSKRHLYGTYPGLSNIDTNVDLRTLEDIISYFPRAAEIGFLAPFPNMWLKPGTYVSNTLMRRITGFEMILIYVSLLGIPFAIWRFHRSPELWIVFILCIPMILILSLTVVNIGSLYRLRYGYIMLISALGLAGIYLACKKRSISSRNEDQLAPLAGEIPGAPLA
jgi:hypothetical protein